MKYIVDVTEHGIIPDGITVNTKRINEVINSMTEGGILFFPPGKYVTGSIVLKSNITFYLSTGAVLLGAEDYDEFPLLTEEFLPGYKDVGRFALITAFNAKNIVIEGGGTIDARGYYWWPLGCDDACRPRTIEPVLCSNVIIRDISIKNSPFWTIHPMCCRDVLIENIKIKNPYDSPNTDGINPESSSNVHISGCTVDVGDDCITVKSGREDHELQRQYPCENILIENCTLLNGHGGVVIGSEMSGGVRRVVVSNCIFKGTDRGIRIKTRRGRGGVMRELMANNLLMEDVLVPFTVNGFYFYDWEKEGYEAEADSSTPIIENITISNLRASRAKVAAIYIKGLPEMPVRGIMMENVRIHTEVDENVADVPIMTPCVEKMQGRGVFLDNIEDSSFENIKVFAGQGQELNVGSVSGVVYNGKEL